MAWTQTQLDALENAIAQGVLTVEYGDKRVTYQSTDLMLKLRAQMQAEISPTGSVAKRTSPLKYCGD